MRLPGTHSTNLNGPLPIVATPLLKSSVVLPSAAFFDWIAMLERSSTRSGYGSAGFIRIGSGSTTTVFLTALSWLAHPRRAFGPLSAPSTEDAMVSAGGGGGALQLTPQPH